MNAPTDTPPTAHAGPSIRAASPRLLAAFVVMGTLYTWAFFQRVCIGTIFDDLQKEPLSLKAVQVTRLGTIYLAIYAPMQLISGFLADRFGGARVIILGGVFLAIGAIAFPLSKSVATLYLAQAFIGLGASVMFICAAREISDRFGDRGFTYLFGPLLFMGGVGAMLATAPFQRSVQVFGWRETMLCVGVITAVCLIAFALLIRGGHHERGPSRPFHPRDLLAVVTNKLTLPGLLVGPLSFTVYLVMQATIGKKCLQDLAGLRPVAASNVTFAMSVLSMSIALMGGLVSRVTRHGRKPIVLLFGALTVIACVLLLQAARSPQSAAVCLTTAFLLLATANGLTPILSCSYKELSHPRHIGLAIGFGNMVTYFSVAIANDLVGRVLDHYKPAEHAATQPDAAIVYPPAAYGTIFIGCIVFAIGCFTAGCFVKETNGRTYLRDDAAGMNPQ